MATLKANGTPVIAGTLYLPRSGRGTFRGTLAALDGPGPEAPLSLEFEDGSTYALTVTAGRRLAGSWSVHAVMGADKLGAELPAKFYEGIPAATVLTDAINECGETPGTVEVPGVLRHWARQAGPAFRVIAAVLSGTGIAWRCNPDGSIRIAEDDWPAGPAPRIQRALGPGRVQALGQWGLQPGHATDYGRVDSIRHTVGPGRGTVIRLV